jgi:hypothetical protein
MKIVREGNVLPSSTNPTRPFTKNTIDEHLDMVGFFDRIVDPGTDTVSLLLLLLFTAHGLSSFRRCYS